MVPYFLFSLNATSISAKTSVFASAISNQQCPAISDSNRVNIIVINRDPIIVCHKWRVIIIWPLARVRTIIAGRPQPRKIGVHVFFCLSAPCETNIFGERTSIFYLFDHRVSKYEAGPVVPSKDEFLHWVTKNDWQASSNCTWSNSTRNPQTVK